MVKLCETTYPTSETTYNEIFDSYPFELDHFQKYAIQAIEEDKHVLITAHTGSGKTLAGRICYSKAFCRAGKKVHLYMRLLKVCPIKNTMSFQRSIQTFSFGILTGDIKFNPEADCIIMTTEILRNRSVSKYQG